MFKPVMVEHLDLVPRYVFCRKEAFAGAAGRAIDDKNRQWRKALLHAIPLDMVKDVRKSSGCNPDELRQEAVRQNLAIPRR